MKLSVAIVSSPTCNPARLTFKLMTRAKYCKTASLDSGPARTKVLKIWNRELYMPMARLNKIQRAYKTLKTHLQTFQRSSQTSSRTLYVRTALPIQVPKVCFRNVRPLMSKHIQPTQRAHQAHPLDVRCSSTFGIPFVQSRDHNRDWFNRHKSF